MQFASERITRYLEEFTKRVNPIKEKIDGFKYIPCNYKADNTLPKVIDKWEDFKENDRWGGHDTHYWFYKKIVIPQNMKGQTVELNIVTGKEGQWDACNPQFLVYIDSKIVQGMDVNHTSVTIENDCEVYLYAYAGMNDELIEFIPTLRTVDKLMEKVYYDIKIPLEICGFLDKNDKRYIDIMDALERAINVIDFDDAATLKEAEKILESKIYNGNSNNDITVNCIGHTHIDVAWLWTVAQTREKAQRSFATVLNLMKQYPEYKFMSSQPQLYKYVKEDAPELYEEIKRLVREGRWEVEGAMWLEADCNLPSGESLVRQILFGKRFIKEEFGVDSKTLWLPDVFGYSAALPQILKKCGVDTFVTSKISWNEYNQMPYDTFQWQGLDGSEVLTYFITAQNKYRGKAPERYTTYVGHLKPSMIAGCWERYQQKNINDETMLLYGYGDGGGGPTKEMLENYDRLKGGIVGCPTAKIDTAANFLNRLKDKVKNNQNIPKWVGELYLEYHRGTYTSIAKIKKNNRECEFLLQKAELLSAIDMVQNGGKYPTETINACWEKLLLNQFHDIIPGSSIKEVYEDSDKDYAEIRSEIETIVNEKIENISKSLNTSEGTLIFNPNSFDCSDVIDHNGKKVYVSNVPAKGFSVVQIKEQKSEVTVKDDMLENKFFKVKFDKNMEITSIYDKKNNREVVKPGEKANKLIAFEDIPHAYDAWDINIYYKKKYRDVSSVSSCRIIDEGARAGFEITRQFRNSQIIQRIYLYNDIPKIDFDNSIDWKEKHTLLKTTFSVDIQTDKATYDTQFGTLERPTHSNTSWDAAKFEVCAHKWADLSENGYGVSLLNNCKYGHDISGNVMGLSLIKSAEYPNPDADRELHEFTYSLVPHSGSYREGNTVMLAYSLNNPLMVSTVSKNNGKHEPKSFVKADHDNVVIDTVKKSEDGNFIIIRMFETYGRRSKTKISFGFTPSEAYICDMMENEQNSIIVNENTTIVELKPFEILTLKVKV